MFHTETRLFVARMIKCKLTGKAISFLLACNKHRVATEILAFSIFEKSNQPVSSTFLVNRTVKLGHAT